MPGCDHLIIDNKNGVLIKPRSINAIEEAINSICRQELTIMGELSYEIYKSDFSEEVVYKSTIEIYEMLFAK